MSPLSGHVFFFFFLLNLPMVTIEPELPLASVKKQDAHRDSVNL